MDPDLLLRLYRHARNDDGKRCLFEGNPSFPRGWVNLDSPPAQELISAFVPLDDADNLKEARRNAQANLEAQAWNDLLGIDDPPIVCKVKIHGAKWGLRFQSAEPTMRGREILNEGLPPIPADGDATPSDALTDAEPQCSASPPAEQPPTPRNAQASAAENVLRRAGLPS